MAVKSKYIRLGHEQVYGMRFGKAVIEYSGFKPELFVFAAAGAGIGAVLGYQKKGPLGAVIGAALGAALLALIEQILENTLTEKQS